ncbi:hypothetical protein BKA61DRAFT_687347 [Leptodontidium sp. MPI-SDFR-AT-0119]|nr:hypothetical protein BKA61DRAFT_687347 [Leptodontidium sp. MPI-SDFR-AT-0119]
MQLLTLMLSFLLLALTTPLVSAGPFMSDHLPTGCKLGKMGFHGDVAGHEISYNGTIEEILAYAETRYPGITKSLAARDDVPLDATAINSPNMVTRDTEGWYYGGPFDGKGHKYCGANDCPLCKQWGYAINHRIQDGINYLNKVTATCNTDAHTVRTSLPSPPWNMASRPFAGRTRVNSSQSASASAVRGTPLSTCASLRNDAKFCVLFSNDMNEHVELPCNWDLLNDYWDHPQSNGQQWDGNKAYNVFIAWASC